MYIEYVEWKLYKQIKKKKPPLNIFAPMCNEAERTNI